MRAKISTALAVLFPLCLLAQVSVLTADQQRAVLAEYFADWRDSSIAAIQARSHRQTTLRWDSNGEQIRSEIEVECGGGYHLRVFHNDQLTTELYRISGKEYRRENGKWVASPAANAEYRCDPPDKIAQRVAQTRQIYELNLKNLDSIAAREQVTKGPIKEVHGLRCQEWTVKSLPALSQPGPLQPHLEHYPGEDFFTDCIALKDHYSMQRTMSAINSARPVVTTYYDWNKPLALRAPQ